MLISLHHREVKENVVTEGMLFVINTDYIEAIHPTPQYKTAHSNIYTISSPDEPYYVFESISEIKRIIDFETNPNFWNKIL